MDLRRYELATLAVARRLRSSYCMLAHGSVLLEQVHGAGGECAPWRRTTARPSSTPSTSRRDGPRRRGRATTPRSITEGRHRPAEDTSASRTSEILDVVLAAAARCFFSKALDGDGRRARRRGTPSSSKPRCGTRSTVGRPIAAS